MARNTQPYNTGCLPPGETCDIIEECQGIIEYICKERSRLITSQHLYQKLLYILALDSPDISLFHASIILICTNRSVRTFILWEELTRLITWRTITIG